LVTAFPEQVPASLPKAVRHVRYAPFGRLLPRAAALVHHGGIGTAVQAMAAAVPQLVVPVGYDQPDNAARLVRLGVARTLLPRQFRADAATRDLGWLLSSPTVAESCATVARRFVDDRAREAACDVIEAMRHPQ
jgi:UDP:flavonoid glycosyltransferase YjiC (YdhE family)